MMQRNQDPTCKKGMFPEFVWLLVKEVGSFMALEADLR